MGKTKPKIMVTKDGPYLVSGGLPIDKQIIGIGKENEPEVWIQGGTVPAGDTCSLCRCGQSGKKPFCDGAHAKVGFKGTEKASRKPYDEQAQINEGPTLKLKDATALCAAARFCHRGGGTWELTHHSDNLKSRQLAIEEACQCPSGRLTECDKKTGKIFEPEYGRSISLIEDPQNKCSGPIWLRGGILVESADGKAYEVRNRQTLCRCGKSENKPFCDGTHMEIGFSDGDESIK
ncbi:MAG: CDGSH iron-sulfur domain-containing protein [Candidatus Methanomethylicus sp.]|nr:CDGSH iron-sulfur domain-containing protein [Candidatus Methanomethylicus sp.]